MNDGLRTTLPGPPIVYCDTCGCDTIPLTTGLCGFCDRRLIPHAARARKPKPPKPKQPAAWWVRRQKRLGLWP